MSALLLQRATRLRTDLSWEYQLEQRWKDEVDVLLVPRSEYSDALAAKLARYLEAFLGNEVHVVVSRVGHISRGPSGKRPILKTCLDLSLDAHQYALAQPDGIHRGGQKWVRQKWDRLKWGGLKSDGLKRGVLPTSPEYGSPDAACLNVKVPQPPTRRSPAPLETAVSRTSPDPAGRALTQQDSRAIRSQLGPGGRGPLHAWPTRTGRSPAMAYIANSQIEAAAVSAPGVRLRRPTRGARGLWLRTWLSITSTPPRRVTE